MTDNLLIKSNFGTNDGDVEQKVGLFLPKKDVLKIEKSGFKILLFIINGSYFSASSSSIGAPFKSVLQ